MNDEKKPDEVILSFSRKFRKAIFGTRFVAFMTENEEYLLPEEDKESISSLLFFYRNFILKRKNYPISTGDGFTYVDSHDSRVLSDVLGLPKTVFTSLDPNQDILSQLHFEKGLQRYKKQCAQERAEAIDKKWYHDYFINYCAQSGLFFLYDETIPFIENDNPPLPVFFNRDCFDEELNKQVQEFTYEKLSIDFLPFDYDASFVIFMKGMDEFSLEERISYFVNGDYDQKIASFIVDPEYRKRYAKLLRRMIVTFVNHLYDCFMEKVLKKQTEKISYITTGVLLLERKLYCLSSFGGDMFSLDGENWYFSNYQKEEICANLKRLVKEHDKDDLLGIYTELALPYLGYLSLRGKKFRSVDAIVDALPFSKDISLKEYYLSPKRYCLNYSFYFTKRRHEILFYQRILKREGIVYTPVYEINGETQNFFVKIYPKKRKGSLALLFDGKEFSLFDEVYPMYLSYYELFFDHSLERALSHLDTVCEKHAGSLFFSLCSDHTMKDALEILLARYESMGDLSVLLPFFGYLVYLPFYYAKEVFFQEVMKEKDRQLLLLLNDCRERTDSYEPALPYPYVQRGEIFYSFRKTPYSEAYLSLSDKDTITEMVPYQKLMFRRFCSTKESTTEEEVFYILSHLGLPKNIINSLLYDSEINADTIVSKIPFEKNLSHLENNAEPASYDALDDRVGADYNIYANYLRAKAAKKGLYLNPGFHSSDINEQAFQYLFHDGNYHTMFMLNQNHPHPMLKPYLNLDKKGLCCLFASFYPEKIDEYETATCLFRFLMQSEENIHNLLFACESYDIDVLSHMSILSLFYQLYQNLAMACVLREAGEDAHSEYCLNYDYNPKLVYPYVLLGTSFNAYTADMQNGPYFFCECDREPIRETIRWHLSLWNQREIPEEWKTPFVLASVGLPYLVVLSKKDFDFDINSVEEFIDTLSFRDAICRRCLNVPHCAYKAPFRLAYPFKKGDLAEHRFVAEAMIKDGFISPFFEGRLRYLEGNYRYRIDKKYDPRLPYYKMLGKSVPEKIFRYFHPDRTVIQDILYEFGKDKSLNPEALAYVSGVLLDAYQRDPEVFYQFVRSIGCGETLGEMVEDFFPEIDRTREEFKEIVIKLVLKFFACLNNQLVESYLYLERHIGR